jgi:hypothetical protein
VPYWIALLTGSPELLSVLSSVLSKAALGPVEGRSRAGVERKGVRGCRRSWSLMGPCSVRLVQHQGYQSRSVTGLVRTQRVRCRLSLGDEVCLKSLLGAPISERRLCCSEP